ncbi:MAG: glycosyltransferase family 4 protein [Pseudomarimonas sp.]
MHAAIVTETWPPEVNGVALTVQSLVLGLRELGHRVSLVRPTQPAHPLPPGDESMLIRSAALPRYPGLRIGFPAGGRLLRQWQSDRPDAIYVATEGPLGWSAVRTAKRLGIPTATGFHTRFDEYMARYGVGVLTPIAFAWMRRFHNTAEATLVPTTELAEFLQSRGFERVQRLGRAVDTSLFDAARRSDALRASWGANPNDLVVIHVGRLAPEKNLDLAIRSFRRIQKLRAGARFVIVGDGPTREALAAANPDFIFTGVKRGNELAEHFASGDLFLFPSLSETFGNVTLEAMASGVATVAYDYGAAREYLRDRLHGRAVMRDDEAGYVAAATELAIDDGLRQRMANAARAAMLPLHPRQVSEHFAELLSTLANKERAA